MLRFLLVRGWILRLCVCLPLCVLAARVGVAMGPQSIATPPMMAGHCELSGTVTDAAGAPLENVTVTVTNKVADASLSGKTDAQGKYRFDALRPGHVALRFSEEPYYMPQRVADLVLSAGAPMQQDARLVASASSPMKVQSVGMVAGMTENERGAGGATDYVRVAVNAVAGPMGYADGPSPTGATQNLNAQQQALNAAQRYNYPSVIFYISASPLVYLPQDGSTATIGSAQETDRNPLWLDATFVLEPLDRAGHQLPNACTDGSVQVLGLLPQANLSAPKAQVAADVAQGVVDVSGALASFYPGVQGQVAAATKALNVLFQDIFPPRPVAYQYPSMNGNCEVGWFFRPNTTPGAKDGQASILGIQTGIVLLKTSGDVKQIRLSGQTLSAWSKAPSSTSKSLYVGQSADIGVVKLPDMENVDYDNLTSLSMFPSLISQGRAMKILHIDGSADFVKFAQANKLVGTNATYDYVTNASLAAFLGIGAPPAPKGDDAPPAPKPSAAPKEASVKPQPVVNKSATHKKGSATKLTAGR
jgi:hypothetical protein